MRSKKTAITVRTRLLFLGVVNTTVILGIGVGIALFSRQLSSDWVTLKSIAQREVLLSEMKSALGYGGAIHHFKNYVIRQEPRYIERGTESFNRFETAVEAYRTLSGVSQEELDELIVIEETMQAYITALTTARDLFAQGATISEVDATIRIDDGPALQAYEEIDVRMRELTEIKNEEFVGDVAFYTTVFLILGVLGLFIALFLSFRTSRFITRRLSQILGVTSVVAEGDLARGVNMHGNDEIGTLATNFDRAMENLRNLVTRVKESSVETYRSSDVLLEQTEAFSSAVIDIADNIRSINLQFNTLDDNLAASSTATEEILANITAFVKRIEDQSNAVRTTSAAVEEMASSIESVSKIARTKRVAAEDLVDFTETGGQKLDTANQHIEEISHSVDGILEMISVINDVAAQTNLLSMNAAIEAAHAGDAGRGFAVVADEIRKLAESTSENANTISATLSTIIEAIKQAQSAGVESGEAFGRISSGVRDVSDAFQEISGSSEELALGSREILESATALVKITEQISGGSEEMEVGAREISTSLLQVKEISGNTLQSLGEIDGRSTEIAQSLKQISTISRTNKEKAQILKENVDKFRTGNEDK